MDQKFTHKLIGKLNQIRRSLEDLETQFEDAESALYDAKSELAKLLSQISDYQYKKTNAKCQVCDATTTVAWVTSKGHEVAMCGQCYKNRVVEALDHLEAMQDESR